MQITASYSGLDGVLHDAFGMVMFITYYFGSHRTFQIVMVVDRMPLASLHQFAEMDCTNINCQKRFIKIFLNSVFVYDEKVVLTLNYSDDGNVMTLYEIDGGSGHGIRIPSGFVHHEMQIRTLHIVRNVFALTERIPLE